MPHMSTVAPPPLGNFAPFNQMSGFGNPSSSNMGGANVNNEANKKSKPPGDNTGTTDITIEHKLGKDSELLDFA